MLCLIEHQILHPGIRQFLSGLARQDHQNDPFDLVQIEFVGIQRQQAIDDDLSLTRRENAGRLQRGQQSAAVGVEPRQFLLCKYAGLRIWHAAVCIILGFYLASTSFAPYIFQFTENMIRNL